MVGENAGVNWTSANPHPPRPDSIELLATITAPTTVVSAELDVPCFHEIGDRTGARNAKPGRSNLVSLAEPERCPRSLVADQDVDCCRLLEVGNDRVEHVMQPGGDRVDPGIIEP